MEELSVLFRRFLEFILPVQEESQIIQTSVEVRYVIKVSNFDQLKVEDILPILKNLLTAVENAKKKNKTYDSVMGKLEPGLKLCIVMIEEEDSSSKTYPANKAINNLWGEISEGNKLVDACGSETWLCRCFKKTERMKKLEDLNTSLKAFYHEVLKKNVHEPVGQEDEPEHDAIDTGSYPDKTIHTRVEYGGETYEKEGSGHGETPELQHTDENQRQVGFRHGGVSWDPLGMTKYEENQAAISSQPTVKPEETFTPRQPVSPITQFDKPEIGPPVNKYTGSTQNDEEKNRKSPKQVEAEEDREEVKKDRRKERDDSVSSQKKDKASQLQVPSDQPTGKKDKRYEEMPNEKARMQLEIRDHQKVVKTDRSKEIKHSTSSKMKNEGHKQQGVLLDPSQPPKNKDNLYVELLKNESSKQFEVQDHQAEQEDSSEEMMKHSFPPEKKDKKATSSLQRNPVEPLQVDFSNANENIRSSKNKAFHQ